MVNLLLAAALLTASPDDFALPDADPAIFVVQDADTTVYLFGTFHALDGRSDWFNDQVRSAFNQSQELVLETVIPEAPAAPIRPARHFSGQTLSMAPTASFLATTRMAISAGRANGMNVTKGADMLLRRAAELSGKRVEGLETLESQLTMFSRMPAGPAQLPRAGEPVETGPDGDAMRHLSDAMTEMQAAWNHGEQTVFVRMLDQLRQSSPVTYKMLFKDRNARWADWIAARMDTPGAVFVAVGAGHFVGDDSVLVRLAEMGIESRRID
jgi:uncharacterized protein YbaP (TraB family)